MTNIKLKELAKKLNKNISQIAEDTGLNRNTVSALYNGKVDGIKFDTIDKICRTYKVRLSDLLEYSEEVGHVCEPQTLYRQEGEVIPFTMWLPCLTVGDMAKPYFEHSAGGINLYFQKEYGYAYWLLDQMNQVAESTYGKYTGIRQGND